MAIELEDKENVEAPTPQFPYGNLTDNDGSNNGTPVNRQVFSDMFQFLARMLGESDIIPNGELDQAGKFQYYEALIDRIMATCRVTLPSNYNVTPKVLGSSSPAHLNEVNSGTDGISFVTSASLRNTTRLAVTDGISGKMHIYTQPIGVWNMDSNGTLIVPFTGINLGSRKIVSASAIIYDDNFALYRPIDASNYLGELGGSVASLDNSHMYLTRTDGGTFDGPDYDSGTLNRGYISIIYLDFGQ